MFKIDLKNVVSGFASDKSGATAIEYALIAAGISVAIIGGVAAVGGNVQGLFETIAGLL